MQLPYEYDAAEKIVKICGWHFNAEQLEAKAASEHPGVDVSHGVCHECLAREMRALDRTPELNPRWLDDARAEIAAAWSK